MIPGMTVGVGLVAVGVRVTVGVAVATTDVGVHPAALRAGGVTAVGGGVTGVGTSELQLTTTGKYACGHMIPAVDSAALTDNCKLQIITLKSSAINVATMRKYRAQPPRGFFEVFLISTSFTRTVRVRLSV